jgi:hypothetical protein
VSRRSTRSVTKARLRSKAAYMEIHDSTVAAWLWGGARPRQPAPGVERPRSSVRRSKAGLTVSP